MKSLLRAFISDRGPAYVGRGVRAAGGLLGGSGPKRLLQTYGSVGTVFAIVDKLTEATASVDWHLYRRARPGAERAEIFSHPALDLWGKPNPHYDRHEFVETFQQHLDLVGEAIWYVGRSKAGIGPPLELWPVRPDRVQPVPDPVEFIAGWVYSTPDGQRMPWAVDEVIQLKRSNPMDPYRGLGPVQSILVDIDSERYSAQWNANFFRNSAEPGGIIEIGKHLSDAEFEEWQARWDEQHKGVAKAHRVALLEQGHWVERKYTNRDMQFTELRKVNREIIREAFGFPKPMLGATDDINRANAEAAELQFARWLIVPRLDRIKRALNAKLLPMYGTSGAGLEFDYDDPMPQDQAAKDASLKDRVESAAQLIAAGFDPEDTLEKLSLPAVKVGERSPSAVPGGPSGALTAKVDPRRASETRLEKVVKDMLDTVLREQLDALDEGDLG